MVDLPKKKVGIVACSGEELAEGTVTRLAALRVLEQLRPGDTVTICLPLFLAGGQGDRAFDVLEVYRRNRTLKPKGIAELNEAGLKLAHILAEEVVVEVDRLSKGEEGGTDA